MKYFSILINNITCLFQKLLVIFGQRERAVVGTTRAGMSAEGKLCLTIWCLANNETFTAAAMVCTYANYWHYYFHFTEKVAKVAFTVKNTWIRNGSSCGCRRLQLWLCDCRSWWLSSWLSDIAVSYRNQRMQLFMKYLTMKSIQHNGHLVCSCIRDCTC